MEVRDAATGGLLRTIPVSPPDPDRVVADVTSDASRLIIGGAEDGKAQIWDTVTGKLLRTLEGHVGAINELSYSYDDSTIVTGGQDHTVRLWDAQDGHPIRVLEGCQGPVNLLFFSPDNSRIAAYTDNDRLWIWQVKTGQAIELQ